MHAGNPKYAIKIFFFNSNHLFLSMEKNWFNDCPQGGIKCGIYESLLYPCPSALEYRFFCIGNLLGIRSLCQTNLTVASLCLSKNHAETVAVQSCKSSQGCKNSNSHALLLVSLILSCKK